MPKLAAPAAPAILMAAALFSMLPNPSAGAATESVVYRFKSPADAVAPEGDLIDVNGTLFGTSYFGGGTRCNRGYGCGAVFSVTPSGVEMLVDGLRRGGKTGSGPEYVWGGLAQIGNYLYGTSLFGGGTGCGGTGCGTVFRARLSGGGKAIYAFRGGSDGAQPWAGPINVDGTLYGTTQLGGGGGGSYCTGGCGVVFKITPNGTETVLHAFQGGSDGAEPVGGLIDVGGVLYGLTTYGGTPGAGTVYSITPAGVETVLYAFGGSTGDAGFPLDGLAELGGVLYGTTVLAAAHGGGAVFKVTTAGVETVLYSFTGGSDGGQPTARLASLGGKLYGTTTIGGSGNDEGVGTVFSVTPTGEFKVVYTFLGEPDGSLPWGGLLNVGGTLYGTTAEGGTGYGTVYSVKP